jgi:hypothetical protein
MVICGGSQQGTWELSLGEPPSWAPIAMVVTAKADAYPGKEDQPLTVPPPGVLGNDAVREGHQPPVAVLDSGSHHGTLTLGRDGSFSYRPDPDFNGNDAFTYIAESGDYISAPAKVTIKVASVADPPLAVDDYYSIPLNTPLVVEPPGVLASDVNPDGTGLRATFLSGEVHGSLDFNADGSFTFVPWADSRGGAFFFYRSSSGSGSTVGDVFITVTD